MKRPLRFGVPSLDRLLGHITGDAKAGRSGAQIQDTFGFECADDAATSLCVIGPHGTGKSVLALHFASRYLADCHDAQSFDASVFYVSTDLSHSMATNVWYSFALDVPNLREIPFGQRYGTSEQPEREHQRKHRIPLIRLSPDANAPDDKNLAQFLQTRLTAQPCNQVTFVDLATESAGDDWGFIHRLIAVLKEPPAGGNRHLVIVDAVEGLETLVGDTDAFGEHASRRSRIAQMLRSAANKCHLFFVVEEPIQGHRVPEEFVSDVVIRLRSIRHHGFDRRTVEVQKARGQGQVRGQHPYVIRTGYGSSTGTQQNLDDPPIEGPEARERVVPIDKDKWRYQAYVHVMHSLHFLTRDIMLTKGLSRPDPNQELAAFGVPHLDSMLARNRRNERGLPCSTVTALIGDAGTCKSILGRSFLYKGLYDDIIKSPEEPNDGGQQASSQVKTVAILLTTSDFDAEGLARQFLRWAWNDAHNQRAETGTAWLRNFHDLDSFAGADDPDNLNRKPPSKQFSRKIHELSNENIICRRLEIHDQTSESLIHIVREAIRQAQKKVASDPNELLNSVYRYRESWRVRLVIDDFHILRSTYSAIQEDPLFLPFLMFDLRREGVTTLIVETNPGRPDRERPELFSSELRALADTQLYTWRVGFHGESRVAISAIPPISPDQKTRVREVHWDVHQAQRPTVDRSLELYAGLEQGTPRQIPLEIRLYAETDAFADYIADMNRLLQDFFIPTAFPYEPNNCSIVTGMKPHEYRYLHDFCNLQSEHSLDHTLILAVDEFWVLPQRTITSSIHAAHPLRKEREYLETNLDLFGNEPRRMYRGFRRRLGKEQTATEIQNRDGMSRGRRVDYFRLPSYRLTEGKAEGINGKPEEELVVDVIDRIPFAWDFGFLMCRKSAWNVAHHKKVSVPGKAGSGKTETTVGEILSSLPRTEGHLHNQPVIPSETQVSASMKRPSWRVFLGACEVVSLSSSLDAGRSLAFDVGTVSEETFSCLVLEMWASEIMDHLTPDTKKTFSDFITNKNWHTPEENASGLIEWLQNEQYVIDLYMVWLLLVDLLPLSELANPTQPTRLVERAALKTAAASRQWYKSACQLLSRSPDPEPMEAVGLPGHFSTRGDWFLGVAVGSKSDLLADRVLDIFSSRRNNLTRLYSGIGLPTRILGTDEVTSSGRMMTALTWKDTVGQARTVRYGPLVALGAPEADHDSKSDFCWLFRSSLKNYYNHARIFQRWNSRTILMWHQTKTEAGSEWRSGFALYDEIIRQGRPKEKQEMTECVRKALNKEGENSWTHFQQRCNILKNLLEESDNTVAL